MVWEYSEKTQKLFMDAVQGKPGTHMGELENPDGIGEHGSIACGDALRFTFRVKKHPSDPTQDVILEARYLTFGCTSAIAASEALCALIEEGRYTPLKALEISNQDIVEYLEGLPRQKLHCSVMGAEALGAAVADWARKRGVDLREHGVELPSLEDEDEGRIVCHCFNVTEPYLRRKIRELNLKTIPEITNAIKAGGACMSCHHVPGGLQDLLNEIWGLPSSITEGVSQMTGTNEGAAPQEPAVSSYQLGKRIEKTVEEYIRPLLQRDGGDIEVVDIKDTLVYCRLAGACAGCPGARQTLKLMVEKVLKDQVDERLTVVQV